jgi:hypothetical protein
MVKLCLRLARVLLHLFTSSLFVDETRDTLDTATTSETTNGGLGDSLDVVTPLIKEATAWKLSKDRTMTPIKMQMHSITRSNIPAIY